MFQNEIFLIAIMCIKTYITLIYEKSILSLLPRVQMACMIEAYIWARAPHLQSLLFQICQHKTKNVPRYFVIFQDFSFHLYLKKNK